MKLKIAPENMGERLALMMNLAPQPLIETQVYFTVARAIMAGAVLGIYDALGKSAKSPDEIANICKTNPAATKQLMNALVGIGYLTFSEGKYALRPKFYKWLLSESDSNVLNKMKLQVYEWDWMAHTEEYVKTGAPIELHETITKPETWNVYQEGMRDISTDTAKELAGRLKLNKNAEKMLDIGGSHGLYSIEMCKKNPSLTAAILELPEAIDHASSIASRYGMQDRVKYQSGNVLKDDLGKEQYDLILINNVVHHFSEEENKILSRKVAEALKPGGTYAIGELARAHKPGAGGVSGAALDLYFSLTSSSGTWSVQEMQSWQREAGLTIGKPIEYRTNPGFVSVIARKE